MASYTSQYTGKKIDDAIGTVTENSGRIANLENSSATKTELSAVQEAFKLKASDLTESIGEVSNRTSLLENSFKDLTENSGMTQTQIENYLKANSYVTSTELNSLFVSQEELVEYLNKEEAAENYISTVDFGILENQVENLNDSVNDLKTTSYYHERMINSLSSQMENYTESANRHWLRNQRYWVDSIYGSDENDGSYEAPYQTLNKLFDSLNTSEVDIRAYLKPGTYSVGITEKVLAGVVIHLTGVSNYNNGEYTYASPEEVIVEFNNGLTVYNSHLNFQYLTLQVPEDNTEFYFESCSAALVNCIFTRSFKTYDCVFYATDSTFQNLTFYSSTVRLLGNTTIQDYSSENNFTICVDRGSRLTLRSGNLSITYNVEKDSSTTNNVFFVRESTLCWGISDDTSYELSLTTNEETYKPNGYGLRAIQSTIFCDETILSQLAACGEKGINSFSMCQVISS